MQPPFALVVCISSTALFDCSESHRIWKRYGLEAYKNHQRSHIKIPLQPGVGFPLVQSLLELNKVANEPLVDVVLVSRNDAESGQRVIESINYHKLSIKRMSFTCGIDVIKYLSAWKCDLFLSTEEREVRGVLAGVNRSPCEGIAAGLVYHMIPDQIPVQPTFEFSESDNIVSETVSAFSQSFGWPKDQVRIVFDGDGVLFSRECDPTGIQRLERGRGRTSLPKGPMQAFALKLQNVRRALGKVNGWRVRIFLVTVCNDESAKQVFDTLREWGLEIEETHILGGLDNTPFLRAIDPAIFFDNSNEHIEQARQHIPAAYILSNTQNSHTTIDTAVLSIAQPISKRDKSDTESSDDDIAL